MRYPSTAPTFTVLPGFGASGGMRNVPLSVASISWKALSPSSVKSGSPLRTRSPSFLSQPMKVPSSMVQPSRGTVISNGMVFPSFIAQVADSLRDCLGVWNHRRFERWAIRSGRVRAVETPDRRIQIIETNVRELGGDFLAKTERGKGLVHDEQPTGFRHRITDGFNIERRNRARIDQLDGHAFGG